MCGDYCCPSCGPAQGNHRCPICSAWASDGCDHLDDETGDLKPEFSAEAERIAEADARAEASLEDLAERIAEADARAEASLEDLYAYEAENEPPRCPSCGQRHWPFYGCFT